MSPDTKRIFLFANGLLPNPAKIRPIVSPEDTLIAVDGGLRHLVALGLSPTLIIGDLDSADPELVRKFKNQNVEIRRFPAKKDQTDLELALDAAIDMGPAKIVVVGALGGRIDQTLGNIFLLTKPELARINIRLMDGNQELFLIRESAQLQGQPGQRVSLLPLQGPVEGVRTEGLKYPLDNETLYPDQTRGISNLMQAPCATIDINTGLLLCIHEFSIKPQPRRD
jgi:thiamine pyrophosphokinase